MSFEDSGMTEYCVVCQGMTILIDGRCKYCGLGV